MSRSAELPSLGDVILFVVGSGFAEMAESLQRALGWEPGTIALSRFANGELYATLGSAAAGRQCVVLGTIAPPEPNLCEFLLACHTLKNEGAARVTALLPYLAYSRQDRRKAGESLGAAWIGSLLQASGVDNVVTVDAHSVADAELFPVPLTSLSPAAVFAQEIERLYWPDATIVAPDEGALERCNAVRELAHIASPVAHLEKSRTRDGVRHSTIQGEVTARVVVVDDILDTGGTLVSCCQELQRAGARDIVVMVTHGRFTSELWQQLWCSGVRQICTTDASPLPAALSDRRVVSLSVVELLCRHFARHAAEPARSSRAGEVR